MNLKTFIQDFINRKGINLLIVSVYEKGVGFLLVFIATHQLTKDNYGSISYASSILDIFFSFIGFGLHYSLLRFGSLSKSQIEKKKLFNLTLKNGFLFSLLLVVIIIILSPILSKSIESSQIFLIILSFQLVGLYLFEIIRIYAQLLHLNNWYVEITFLKTTLQLLFVFLLTHYYNSVGYVIGLTIVPLMLGIFYLIKDKLIEFKFLNDTQFSLKKFFNYGIQTSFSGILSQLIYATDIILIGNILKNENMLAQYKVSNVLPYSFLFISVAFIKTHIVKISAQSVYNKRYIWQYYLNYLKIFSVISVLMFLFLYFFSHQILMLFGKNYTGDFGLMNIFTFGAIGAVLFRIPLGNILAAVGWVRFNTVNALFIAILNLIINYYIIHNYGIVGAAWVTSSLLWFSGVLSLFAFVVFLKKNRPNLEV